MKNHDDIKTHDSDAKGTGMRDHSHPNNDPHPLLDLETEEECAENVRLLSLNSP